jgi:hypothetical protein
MHLLPVGDRGRIAAPNVPPQSDLVMGRKPSRPVPAPKNLANEASETKRQADNRTDDN